MNCMDFSLHISDEQPIHWVINTCIFSSWGLKDASVLKRNVTSTIRIQITDCAGYKPN